MKPSNHGTPPSPTVQFGARLKSLREKRKLSQAAVAEAAGMDRSDLWRIEQGEGGDRGPTLATINKLAKAIGVDPSELLHR